MQKTKLGTFVNAKIVKNIASVISHFESQIAWSVNHKPRGINTSAHVSVKAPLMATLSVIVRLVRGYFITHDEIFKVQNLENLITVPWMEAQTLPFKVRSYSLTVHAEVNHQSEAGSRAQSEPKQIRHTGANGEILW